MTSGEVIVLDKKMSNEEIFKVGFDNPSIMGRVRDLIYEKNTGLIHDTCKKFLNTKFDYDELLSCCQFGFVKGLNTYKIDKDTKFATYVVRIMSNEVLMQLRREKKHNKNISIYEPLSGDEIGNVITLEDILNSDGKVDGILESITHNDDIVMLKEIVSGMKSREQNIINMYFNGKTQREIADTLDISQSYVSRIIKKLILSVKKKFFKLNLWDSSGKNFSNIARGSSKVNNVIKPKRKYVRKVKEIEEVKVQEVKVQEVKVQEVKVQEVEEVVCVTKTKTKRKYIKKSGPSDVIDMVCDIDKNSECRGFVGMVQGLFLKVKELVGSVGSYKINKEDINITIKGVSFNLNNSEIDVLINELVDLKTLL